MWIFIFTDPLARSTAAYIWASYIRELFRAPYHCASSHVDVYYSEHMSTLTIWKKEWKFSGVSGVFEKFVRFYFIQRKYLCVFRAYIRKSIDKQFYLWYNKTRFRTFMCEFEAEIVVIIFPIVYPFLLFILLRDSHFIIYK